MKLKLKRIIIFTDKMHQLTAFYGKKIGLSVRADMRSDPANWIEFDAGGARIALHKAHGNANRACGVMKLVFFAKDVAKARAELLKNKVKMGTIHHFREIDLCDGRDAGGNRIQLSNRP